MNPRVAAITFGALLAAHAAAAQTTTYAVVDLGRLPDAFTTQPLAINDRDEVVGYTQGPQTLLRAFVWRPGQGLVELPPPPGYTDNRATDISDDGQVITGAAQNGIAGMPRGWRFRNGAYELLPETLDGCAHLFPNAVNNDGTVVGRTLSTNVNCPQKAFYYSDTFGLIDLTTLFNAIDAIDVNNAGIATGEGFDTAYRYAPGLGYQPIGTLPAPYDDSAQGRAINDSNQVAGRSINALIGPDHWRAFLYTDGTGMQNISFTNLARSSAEGLNDHGDVVGNDGTTSTSEQYPWIWTPTGGRRLLEQIITAPNGFVSVAAARDISNSRRIIAKAGRSDPADGYGYGVLLVPTPSNQPPMSVSRPSTLRR
jgi:probable HAF family extracellular repeat protein